MSLLEIKWNLREEHPPAGRGENEGIKQYINGGIAYYDKSEEGKYTKGNEITIPNPDTKKEEVMLIIDVFKANDKGDIGVSFKRKQ